MQIQPSILQGNAPLRGRGDKEECFADRQNSQSYLQLTSVSNREGACVGYQCALPSWSEGRGMSRPLVPKGRPLSGSDVPNTGVKNKQTIEHPPPCHYLFCVPSTTYVCGCVVVCCVLCAVCLLTQTHKQGTDDHTAGLSFLRAGQPPSSQATVR